MIRPLLFGIAMMMAMPAHAYVLPSWYIVNRMVKDHVRVKQAEFEALVVNPRNQTSFKEVMRVDFVNGRGTAWALNEAGQVLGMRSFRVSELHPLGAAWLVPGFDPNASRVQSVLQKLQVSPSAEPAAPAPDTTPKPAMNEDVKLERLQQRVFWTWGNANRISILKDGFNFSGFHKADSNEDLIVAAFNSTNSGFAFPKSLKLSRGGNDLFTYEVKSSRFNTPGKINFPKPIGTSPTVEEWFDLVR